MTLLKLKSYNNKQNRNAILFLFFFFFNLVALYSGALKVNAGHLQKYWWHKKKMKPEYLQSSYEIH